MNIIFLNEKQDNSALLDIFTVNTFKVEILKNGAITDPIIDPLLFFFTFGKSESNMDHMYCRVL